MLGFASTAFAQFERGTISGTIKDAQGGVVPGVTVTATNLQTQTPTVTVTDATGYYTFANLAPGRYNITAELQGFKKIVREDVQLDAAGALVIDFALETGDLTEQVTVTAESPPLQTDVTIRKTVESKDIEQLSFSGRNPIGVASLKAGVVGGIFNSRGFDDLGNGGFNINGSRSDENNITVDGATAIRTRSSGAIIGIQNVDAIQEVQVLTANYMPEFGRASGGQIRFVTKSGSNRYRGSASFFYRDDSLQANSWARNASTTRSRTAAGAVRLQAVRLFVRRPDPRRHVQGQAVLLRRAGVGELLPGSDGDHHGADRGDAPRRLQRAAERQQRLLHRRARHHRSADRPAVPGQRHSAGRLSPNGMAFLNAYPLPTPGFRQGTNNAIITSPNPQDQRKDNIRFDYRLNNTNQFTYRYSRTTGWPSTRSAATCRSRAPPGSVRTTRTTATWTSTLTQHLINELTYTYSKDDVFINVFTEDGASTSAARRASTIRTCSRRRKSSTRFRRSRIGTASRRWTAGRIRRPRRVRSTPSRTRRRG